MINVWGVGTKLITAFDQPALGAVYKLTALRNDEGKWDYKVKLSEQTLKISTPGIQQVRRYTNEKGFTADMIYDTEHTPTEETITIIDPMDFTKQRKLSNRWVYEDLLVPILRKGKLVYQLPSLESIRQRVHDQLPRFHEGIKRFVNPHVYHVGLEKGLYEFKTNLILELRSRKVSEQLSVNSEQ